MKYDIWPNINTNISYKFNNISIEETEKIISDKFEYPYILLLSSGKSAIVSCLKALNIQREEYIGYSPYSNSCIFRTIGEMGSPIPLSINQNFKCSLIFHQWGYIQKHNSESDVLIEDSVDSLILNNKTLFPNNGDFEIISLSKTLSLPYGAIVFCKNKDLYNELKIIRDRNKKLSKIQSILKYFSKHSQTLENYWQLMEIYNAHPGNILNNLIKEKFKNYNMIVEDRIKKIELLKDFIEFKIELNRLPCVIPVSYEKLDINIVSKINILKHTARHLNVNFETKKWNLKKFLPVPIHQDISMQEIEKIKNLIRK